MTNFPVVVFDNESNLEYANELANRELNKSKLVLEENKTHKIDDIPIIFNNVENCVRLKADNKKIYICLSSKLVENNKKFMANFSHEIRTPLNAIIGAMSLMADTELTKDQKNYTEMINEGSFNLLRLVNDILDHTRLDTGRLAINKKEMSIRECVSSSIKVVGYKASTKKINIKCNISHIIEDTIISDHSRIRQILVNLYYNSVKFSPENSIINTDISLDSDGFIVFSVSDNGPGVPIDLQPDLFTSFSRIHSEHNSEDQEGLGLGLSICKDLVKLLGGNICYNSEYTFGAEFVFCIPYETPKKQNPVIIENTCNQRAKDTQILLYHPDIKERMNISRQVSGIGLDCCSVASIKEISDITSDSSYYKFVLVVDSSCMTEDLGLFMREISKNTLFVFLANHIDIYNNHGDEYSSQHWMSFFDHVINKPFEISKMIKIVRELPDETGQIHSNNCPVENSRHIESAQFHVKEQDTVYSKLKVLVDEDVYLNRIVIKKLLEKIGFRDITMVENGLEAYNKMLSGYTCDICIIDIKTPKMSGVELIKKIKSYKKNGCGINWHCIAVTANTESENFFIENKFDNFIIKPINFQILKEKIDLYLLKNNFIESI
jgi:signal transduction histidine kinase